MPFPKAVRITAKQRAFAKKYIKLGSGNLAAKAIGCKPSCADSCASRWLSKYQVRKLIRTLKQTLARSDANEIAREWAKLVAQLTKLVEVAVTTGKGWKDAKHALEMMERIGVIGPTGQFLGTPGRTRREKSLQDEHGQQVS